jgi:hypothetical protein
MIRRRLWARRSDDRGTSLVLALIFISVGSLVLMAVLALADTSMRATIRLSSQADDTSLAEGAANVAINALRKNGTFGATWSCFNGGKTLSLPNFYQLPDGTPVSAYATCDLDMSNTIGTPPKALLTLDANAPGPLGLGPFGIYVTNPQTNGSISPFSISGDVQSNSSIEIGKPPLFRASGNLTSNGNIRARLGCTSGSGLFTPPTPTCNIGGTGVADPGYTTPTTAELAALPTQSVPTACTANQVFTFQQGRYTNVAALTLLTSPACNAILQFLPGIYFFDFGPSPVAIPWTVSAGTVIGGKLRGGVRLGPGMPATNNCVSPIPTGPGWTAPAPEDGVTFVFSGVSEMVVSGSAKVELCGRYAGTSAPVAVTALPTTGVLTSTCTLTTWPCAAVATGTPTSFVVQGTVYLPSRELVLVLNNSSVQSIRDGAVVRRAWATTSRSSSNTTAVIEAPDRRTVLYVNVYLCPGKLTCSDADQLMLRTKVSLVDPAANPTPLGRKVTVLSWSLQS